MRMSHICVRGLLDLSKWGFLNGKKFWFYERCIHGKKYKGVTFGGFFLMRQSKQFIRDIDLGVPLELECEASILLGCDDAILVLIQVSEIY